MNKGINPFDSDDYKFLYKLAKDGRYSPDDRLAFLSRSYKLQLKLDKELSLEEREEKERWIRASEKMQEYSSYHSNFEEVQDCSDGSYEYQVLFSWIWAGDDLEKALEETKAFQVKPDPIGQLLEDIQSGKIKPIEE